MRPIAKVVGENVTKYREVCGYSINKLAVEAGTDHPRMKRIEAGTYNVTVHLLENIANVLGVTVIDLVEDWSDEE